MPHNLELKIRCASLTAAEMIAKRIGASFQTTLYQKDTYYLVPSGRLKLRKIRDNHAELIYYQRPNRSGKKYSQYSLLPIENPKETNRFFTSMFGKLVVVQKERRLYLYKNARLHFDRVHGLGTFLEFEVVVSKGKKQAKQLFLFLCHEFGLKSENSLPYSYSDLLMQKKKMAKIEKTLAHAKGF